MRTIVGAIAMLGLAVAVAEAQPPRERGAAFRPPEPLQPGDLPSVARGAGEEFPPSSFPTTPVARPNNRAPGAAGPAWLSGTDPNVLPAAGSATKTGSVRPLTPPTTVIQPKADPYLAPKAVDKLKSAPPPAPRPQPPVQPTAQPPQQPQQPTAETPYRGTSANGAPVYAGPPAYRWYGWGTVTPGANQFAPTGQYPKASAKWFEITGATPGAFPVQVMNPLRTPPGTEPPNYGTTRTPPAPPAVVPIAVAPQYQPQPPQFVERPEPPRFTPPTETKFAPSPPPAPVSPPAPVNVPKITPPPVVPPVAVAPPVVPEPIAVKSPAPVPTPAPVPLPPLPTMPEPVVALPAPVLPPIPVPSVEPTNPVAVVPPSPLPISVTDEQKEQPKPVEVKPEAPKPVEQRWQTSPEPTEAAPGTWAPAGQPLPVHTNDVTPAWKSGSAPVKQIVARAQMPDADMDPVGTLIRQVCQGRADGVDVRWSGTKKLMVCFEVRSSADAQKLVTDISRRPELAPYQIDFCVVVK